MKKIISTIICVAFAITVTCFCGCEDHDNDTGTTNFTATWCYGGFSAPNAVEDPNCQIANLNINGTKGLSYNWIPGKTMAVWGESSPTDCIGIACAGWYDESAKTWKVGKFDWISSSRQTRDFKNISTHYNGWEPDKFFAAKQKCFFIVLKNGTKRTNVLFSE